MERRHFITGMGGALTVLAGCTGSGDEATGEPSAGNDTEGAATANPTTEYTVPYEEYPGAATLLEEHVATLRDATFEATESIEQERSSGESDVTEKRITGGEAGTLLEGDDVARSVNADGTEQLWFTDRARVSRIVHRFNPDGVTPPIVDRSTVSAIGEIAVFERADVTDDEPPVVVFEATGPSEAAEEDEVDYRTVDVTVEVVAPGYIRTIDAVLELAESADAEESQTVTYEYEVTEFGGVSVAPPDFVDDALHVQGDLTDDRSAIRLDHAGGPTVQAGTPLTFQDNEYIAISSRGGPTFPAEFAEGDSAYVYWSGEEEASIRVGEKPSTVTRDIALPSESGDRSVYMEQEDSANGKLFQLSIDRQG
ncbi:hypothetical protein [Haloparvum sp. PAK95]|uniref:hypothetical protein n=1 Tax=Haloparvum sp. PAK95 TaxID=3418962 RepID=UPI003D2EE66D